MVSMERRNTMRLPAYFAVDYIHDGRYLISTGQDISVNGMFITTPDPPPPGTHLRLIFSLDDQQDFEITSLVVWTKKGGAAGETGMGVQFLSPLPVRLKEAVIRHIKRVLVLGRSSGANV